MERDELWDKILQFIGSKLENISFNIWFKDAKLIDIKDGTLIIQVDSPFIKEHINSRYEELVEEAIKVVSNISYTFEILTPDEIKQDEEEVIIEEPRMEVVNRSYKSNNSNLNPSYTFDNFCIGETNRLAVVTALGVAENPDKCVYNPLFIHGKSGLGKTHLMHAIGNYIEKTSDLNVLYITSETFVSDFTLMTKKGDGDQFDQIQHFKDKYRNIDVLIIDDIQMLAGANKTQEEFFHTFNFLYGLNKQIIISSDRSPDDLKLLEDRLTTRFSWGLTVNIDPPDYELRLKILKNKIAGHESSKLIKPEVLDYIANNCESDVRHLEGCINRLYAFTAMYCPKEVNLEFAQDALKDVLGSSMYVTNSIIKIQKAVADYYNFTVETLKSKKRTADVSYARNVAIYLCKMTTDETLEKIGLEFNRNHSTVIHSCELIEKGLEKNERLKQEIKDIKVKIAN